MVYNNHIHTYTAEHSLHTYVLYESVPLEWKEEKDATIRNVISFPKDSVFLQDSVLEQSKSYTRLGKGEQFDPILITRSSRKVPESILSRR